MDVGVAMGDLLFGCVFKIVSVSMHACVVCLQFPLGIYMCTSVCVCVCVCVYLWH